MALPDFLPGRFALARGRPGDYFLLEHFHYLPKRPATYADVWVVTYADPHDLPYALHPAPHVPPHLAPPHAAGLLPSNVLRFDEQDNRPQAASLHAESTVASFRDDAVRFAQHDALDARRSVASRRDDHPDRAARAPRVVAVGVLSYPTIRSSPRERTLGLRASPRASARRT